MGVAPTAVDADDPRSYYRVARKLAKEIPNAINALAHYESAGPEIWEQTGGAIVAFVCGIGTAPAPAPAAPSAELAAISSAGI